GGVGPTDSGYNAIYSNRFLRVGHFALDGVMLAARGLPLHCGPRSSWPYRADLPIRTLIPSRFALPTSAPRSGPRIFTARASAVRSGAVAAGVPRKLGYLR